MSKEIPLCKYQGKFTGMAWGTCEIPLFKCKAEGQPSMQGELIDEKASEPICRVAWNGEDQSMCDGYKPDPKRTSHHL